MAARALSGLVADRRRVRVRRRPHGPRRARALRLHDRLRPPLRLPARPHGPDRGRGAGGARARRADRRLARLDGSRGVRRRAPARRAGRGHRRGAGRHRAPRRRAARAGAGRARPDRGGAVLAVLGHEEAHDRVGDARPPARADAPHAPRRDRGGRGVLHGALRLYAGRVPDRPGLARPGRVVRALRPPLRRRHRGLRRLEDGRRALPDLEPPPRRRRRARARLPRRRSARRPRRRRLGVERAERPPQRGEAGASRRARTRRAAGD